MIEAEIEKYNEIKSEITKNSISLFTFRDKYIYLKKILENVCISFTENEYLQFPSLFSRIVFIGQKYNLSKKLEWELQNIRVKTSLLLNESDITISENQFRKSEKALLTFIDLLFNTPNYDRTDVEDNDSIRDENIENETRNIVVKKNYKRVQVVSIDSEKYIINAISSDNETDEIQIRYNVRNVNDTFNNTIDLIWINAQINIIDYNIDNYGIYIPRIIVLEPDYLIDTSAISECFQSYGHSHLHYYLRKFNQISNSQHLLLGNLANYFLDELIYTQNSENLNFRDAFIDAFKQKPFEFTICNDIADINDFKTFMAKSKNQFNNIKRVVTSDLKKSNIDINSCLLEPSFFCEKYGFQGRLDLLQIDYENIRNLNIIELKSGSLPYPKNDISKISINHEVQATIYKLIIESVFNLDRNNSNISTAIMYSAAENPGQNLRYVASYQKLEKEIIEIRNQIIATEYKLYTEKDNSAEKLLAEICEPKNYGNAPTYLIQQIQNFKKEIDLLSDLEKAYLYRYITFISRELYIQKIGDNNYDSYNSTSSLWCTEFSDRQESFDLISNLEIETIDDSGRDLKIEFRRNNKSDFVNFREGELCILYPHKDAYDTVLSNQIMKGTISKITSDRVFLRFRYKQKNKKYFEIHKLWAVEHDRLDHAYNAMFKNLFQFFRSTKEKRNLILGTTKPNSLTNNHISTNNDTIDEKQTTIIQKAITAQDYFLIVGPPGTGKTSIYARKLIEHYYNTNENILIIAYTNRAVDELCETINKAFSTEDQSCNKYIRIGTELSCNQKYRHRLLQKIADKVDSRDELKQIIKDQRIIVGTLASILGKSELLDIKQFGICIIDEASQILEPQIIGILPKVTKFIMIGDHKQLSTITLQNNNHTEVNDSLLNIIKLYNCSESLFERLYRLCEDNYWTDNYDTLIYQGRMHEDIASFVNQYFYNNILLPISNWQNEPLAYYNCLYNNYLMNICASKRIYFFDVKNKVDSLNNKVNEAEAETVVELCKSIVEIYRINNLQMDSDKTLGIITPFRNQIALIRHKLNETNIPVLQNIMIDTVERFQGSQRDIIIFSFCMNKQYQLKSLVNLNNDGSVDRKLNVALTRARKQLFLVGNKSILNHNPLYKKLIAFFQNQ